MKGAVMVYAVIVAGGSGSRIGGKVPKQFLEIGGKSILRRTVEAFEKAPSVGGIVLVVPTDYLGKCREEYTRGGAFSKMKAVVPGGDCRGESVRAGLSCCGGADAVMVHDGARPFVSQDIIARTAEALVENEAVIVAVPSKDTVKIVDEEGFVVETPARKNCFMVQTPQAFKYDAIVKAYEAAGEDLSAFTDDSMVYEAAGLGRVKVIEGSYENKKITTPDDLKG